MTETHKHLNGSTAGVVGDTSESARLLAEWREAMADRLAAFNGAGPLDDDGVAASEREASIMARAWELPVSDAVAMRLRAQNVRDEVWPDLDGSGSARFEAVLAGEEAKDDIEVGAFGERAIGQP